MNPFSIGHKNCVHFFVYHTVNSLFFLFLNLLFCWLSIKFCLKRCRCCFCCCCCCYQKLSSLLFWVFIFYSFHFISIVNFLRVLCTLQHSKHINSFKNEEMREKFHLSITKHWHCTKWKTVYGSVQFGSVFGVLFSLEATKKNVEHSHTLHTMRNRE